MLYAKMLMVGLWMGSLGCLGLIACSNEADQTQETQVEQQVQQNVAQLNGQSQCALCQSIEESESRKTSGEQPTPQGTSEEDQDLAGRLRGRRLL